MVLEHRTPIESVQQALIEAYVKAEVQEFRYANAIEIIDHAISAGLAPARNHTLRGQTVMFLYEWDRALGDFDRAIAIDPAYAEAYYQRGILHYTMAARESALADFEQVLLLQPASPYANTIKRYIESIQSEIDALSTSPPS